MKKLITFALMVCFGLGAEAQIQIEETYANKLDIIGPLHFGANLGETSYDGSKNSNYHLYKRTFKEDVTFGILIQSTNRFDDDVEIALGRTEAEAAESVNVILNFLATNEPKTSTEFTDLNGNKFQFTVYNKNFLSYKVLSYYVGKTFVADDYPYIKKTMLIKALELLGVAPESKSKKKK